MTQELLPQGRICCIDFGLKKIGIAISNRTQTLATKVKTIENKGFNTTSQFLQELHHTHIITSFLVGWPLMPSGDESKQCKLVDNFCTKLYAQFQLPIIKYDERMSTKRCQSIIGHRHTTDDKVATLLLQDFLNHTSIHS